MKHHLYQQENNNDGWNNNATYISSAVGELDHSEAVLLWPV